MFTLGHNFIPKSIHAGGLRYHGVSPIISRLVLDKLIEARAFNQLQTYSSGLTFARTESLICAPETNHAIAAVIEEAEKAREEGRSKVILFNLSGHGLLDLSGYDSFLSGKLTDYSSSEEEMQESLKVLDSLPAAAK